MISLIVKLGYNVLRGAFNKLRYKERYQCSIVERLSSRATISLFNKGHICIGRNVEIAPYVDLQVHGNGKLSIGERTYMNRYCMISCHGNVHIGNNCMFGPGVKIFDNNHRFSRDGGVSSKLNIGSIVIGNNCWIASDVIILKGAKIGNNCVIGAGCIIDKSIPDCTIVRLTQAQITEMIR